MSKPGHQIHDSATAIPSMDTSKLCKSHRMQPGLVPSFYPPPESPILSFHHTSTMIPSAHIWRLPHMHVSSWLISPRHPPVTWLGAHPTMCALHRVSPQPCPHLRNELRHVHWPWSSPMYVFAPERKVCASGPASQGAKKV